MDSDNDFIFNINIVICYWGDKDIDKDNKSKPADYHFKEKGEKLSK